MTDCCKPSSKSSATFSGVHSGNFSRSSNDDCCDPVPKCHPCAELPVQPYTATHEIAFCKCGVHKVPFFMTSRALYNQWLEGQSQAANVLVDHGPAVYRVAGTGAAATASIDPSTFLAADPPTGYVVSASDGAATPIYTAVSVPVLVTDVAIDGVIDICIPKKSDSGVVIDLTDVTTFADSVYSTFNPAIADGVGLLQPFAGISTTAFPTAVANVTPAVDSTTPASAALSGATLSAAKLLNKPRVNIYNRSSCPAYLRVNKCGGKLFEHVTDQLGVRPTTKVTVEYDPQHKVWTILDTNSRA